MEGMVRNTGITDNMEGTVRLVDMVSVVRNTGCDNDKYYEEHTGSFTDNMAKCMIILILFVL